MIKSKLVFLAVTMLLLGACASKVGSMKQADIQAATATCFEQAQDMTNATVNALNPTSNDYFNICMRTRFNYTDKQLATIWANPQ